jgi:ABC-2 type transport system permease protein
MSVSFQTLAISIALEQDDGTLKRLAGTPMPKAAYFIGKLGMVLVVGLAEVAVTLGIGAFAYGVELPGSAARWLTLAWVFVLGISACSLIGIAYSRVIGTSRRPPPWSPRRSSSCSSSPGSTWFTPSSRSGCSGSARYSR